MSTPYFDNRQIDVTSQGVDDLRTVLALFGKKAIGSRVVDNRLLLYWTTTGRGEVSIFPAPLEPHLLAGVVAAWLESATYPPEPDHDGDNEKGWRVWCDGWGHGLGEWEAFAVVEPVWAMYGK